MLVCVFFFFFFKQKTAYEMRISDEFRRVLFRSKPAVSAVKELLAQEPDALREIVRSVMQAMLEAEMGEALGAGKSERSDARLGYRSGHYPRTLVTRVGKLELRVPQDRAGRFSTELFERYQRSEQALVATLDRKSPRLNSSH